MIKVEIDRSRWYRGAVDGSQLQRETDGKRCCLGFAALACGYEEVQIVGTLTPSELVETMKLENHWPKGSLEKHTPECNCGQVLDDSRVIADMMAINDHPVGEKFLFNGEWKTLESEQEREQQLTELAAKIGLEFTFVGEPEQEL